MKPVQIVETYLKQQDGQDEWLNELYAQMLMVAYSKVHNKTDALDIVQESWLKILQKIDSLKDKDKLVQWAKAIVSNTALNAIRKRNSHNAVVLLPELLICSDDCVESEIEDRMLRQSIYEAIEQLDNETRKMLLYKCRNHFTDKQISEWMGIPLGTVKARIHRGKEKIRIMLT